MKRDIIRLIILAALLAAIIIPTLSLFNYASAEEVWILCHPDSFVCLRDEPRKTSCDFGGATCGTKMETDGKTKGGYMHVSGLAAEAESGWVSAKYVVHSEPHEVNKDMVVSADGRVAIRKCVGGKITGWLYDGDIIHVLWACDEWAITTRGYVMTNFLR